MRNSRSHFPSLVGKAIIVSALPLLLLPTPLLSEPSPFRGIGFAKCEELNTWQATGAADLDFVWSWFYGYWTGLNLKNSAEADSVMRDLFHFSVSPDSLVDQLGAICRERPDDFIVNAGADLFDRLPEIDDPSIGGTQ